VLAYNPLWHEKSDKVGVEDPYKNNKTMTSFTIIPSQKVQAILRDAGINEAKS